MNISTPKAYGSNLLHNPSFPMARPKEIKDCVRVSLVLSKAQAEYVKKRAIRMSSQEGRQITFSEMLRAAIEEAYPIPKDRELF